MKHTPPPWDVVRQDDDDGSIWYDIWSGQHGSVAHVSEGARPVDRVPFTKADAHLIAAAPNLLAELGDAPILSQFHGVNGFETERFIKEYESWSERRRSAIAKARGQS